MKAFLQSAKTNFFGALILVCGGVAFTGVLENYNSFLMLFCSAMTAAGFFASKDADKSNAPVPTPEAHKVPDVPVK